MILPDRKTIRPLLEEQKYQSAKEGIALATKVDALRKEYNELKRNREVFLQGTVLEIERTTKVKSETLKTLQEQIDSLEARRLELLKPLNSEWQELKIAQKDFEKQQKDFTKRESDLEAIKQDVTKKEQKIAIQDQKTELEAQETERLNEQSKKDALKARQILQDATANLDEIEKECTERLLKVSELENQVDFDKQAVENIKKTYILKEKELIKREKLLKDREQMLLRNLKRNAV
jgi:hypothetical protein